MNAIDLLREAMELAARDRIAHDLGAVTDTTLEQMIDDPDVDLDRLRTIVLGLVSDAIAGLVDSTDLTRTTHPGRFDLDLTTAAGSVLELELGVVFRSTRRAS